MVALSFSSCSRAATPAADRASTRWTSTKAIFVVAGAVGAWAPAGGAVTATPTRSPTASAPEITRGTSGTLITVSSSSEGGAHGELELPEALARPAIEIDAVVY